MVLIDTCGIIELCKPVPALKPSTIERVDAGAVILSISFAEIGCKVKAGKLRMSKTPLELYKAFLEIQSISLIDIGVQEWLDSINLDWPQNRDPADRLVVAYARTYELTIVSSDKMMRKFYKHVIW